MSAQNVHPEIAEVDWIDDSFRVERKRFGTWDSYTKDGKCVITSYTKEICIHATRCYLKWLQEGFPETKSHEGVVGGKL
jgi:hypothetical protein